MNLKTLMGSGDKIWRFAMPYLIVGLVLNILFPSFFSVSGPSPLLRSIFIVILAIGLINWIWSGILILLNVPKNRLITSGPYALVKHPIYVGFACLVFPWLGFIFNSWLGVFAGIMLYIGSRKYAPLEEKALKEKFGAFWDDYCQQVKIKWL
jgi:protein-S-isoprenylcysteine O-methyltransferase Ste14